jgi:hypothetical protein
MWFVALLTAHVRAVSGLRGRRNELHNFFILDVLAWWNDGRSNPSKEVNLASRRRQWRQKVHSVLYKLLIEIADRGKVQTPRVFYRREPDAQPWVIANSR